MIAASTDADEEFTSARCVLFELQRGTGLVLTQDESSRIDAALREITASSSKERTIGAIIAALKRHRLSKLVIDAFDMAFGTADAPITRCFAERGTID